MLRRYLDTLQAHNTRIISAGGGGGGSQWITNGTSIYYNTGNVGVGVDTPSSKMTIVDNTIGVATNIAGGMLLANYTAATNGTTGLKNSPSVTFRGSGFNTTTSLPVSQFSRIVQKGSSHTNSTAQEGDFVIESLNNAGTTWNTIASFTRTFNAPILTIPNGNITTGGGTFNGAGGVTITTGGSGSSLTLNSTNNNLGRTILARTGSYNNIAGSGNLVQTDFGITTSINATVGTSDYTGFLFNPTVTGSTGLDLKAFKNTIGNNTFNTTSGSTIIGGTTPSASAILDITSTTRGILIPRMTLTQRNAIASPAAGLQVIVTGETGGEFVSMYNSSLAAWQRVGAVAGSNTQIQYNNAGALGASPTFSYDDALKSLKVDSIYIYQGRNRNAGNVVVGRNEGVAGVPLSTITTGTNNTGLGTSVLANITSAVNNIGIGYYSLRQDTTGSSNIGIGTFALTNLRNGANNTAIGIAALQTITTASGNVAIGTNASTNLTAGNSNNTVVGNDAHGNASTGAANVFIGKGAGQFAGGADLNAIVGMNAMQLGSGDQTAAIGYEAGLSTTGNNNTYAGFNAGKNITSGANNTVIGSQSGSALGITTGSNNTIIGAGVNGLATTLANNIVIADGAGNQRINANSSGSVGIGTGVTIAASARLEITSTTQGVLFPRMTTAQKTAIVSPAAGLQVYDTTLNQMSYYNGTTWVNF
jgi:hypothetical protein